MGVAHVTMDQASETFNWEKNPSSSQHVRGGKETTQLLRELWEQNTNRWPPGLFFDVCCLVGGGG